MENKYYIVRIKEDCWLLIFKNLRKYSDVLFVMTLLYHFCCVFRMKLRGN